MARRPMHPHQARRQTPDSDVDKGNRAARQHEIGGGVPLRCVEIGTGRVVAAPMQHQDILVHLGETIIASNHAAGNAVEIPIGADSQPYAWRCDM